MTAFTETLRVYIRTHIRVIRSLMCVLKRFEAVSTGEFQTYRFNALF